MTMIQSLINTTVNTITDRQIDDWELYLDYIRTSIGSEEMPIKDSVAYANEFDLYAIFCAENIPERYYYPLMRLNGFRSPCEFDGNLKKLRIWDANGLDTIYKTYIIRK